MPERANVYLSCIGPCLWRLLYISLMHVHVLSVCVCVCLPATDVLCGNSSAVRTLCMFCHHIWCTSAVLHDNGCHNLARSMDPHLYNYVTLQPMGLFLIIQKCTTFYECLLMLCVVHVYTQLTQLIFLCGLK